MGEHVLIGLEELGIIVPVHDALVHNGLGVHILVILHLSPAVQLVSVALGAEGDEHRQGAEVVNVVVHRAQE